MNVADRSLANSGLVSAPGLQPPVDATPAPGGACVMDEAAWFIVADILIDNGAPVPAFGLDNALATRYWGRPSRPAPARTRDNGCVDFGARCTVGVWVGNAAPRCTRSRAPGRQARGRRDRGMTCWNRWMRNLSRARSAKRPVRWWRRSLASTRLPAAWI